MTKKNLLALGLALTGLAWSCSDSGSGTNGPAPGAEGGPCPQGRSCDVELACINNVCARPGAAAGAGGSAGTGGSAGSVAGAGGGTAGSGGAATGAGGASGAGGSVGSGGARGAVGAGGAGGKGNGNMGGSGGTGGTKGDPAAPTCTITAPLNKTSVDYDKMVTLVATASDPEDGPLTGASVVWRSDLVVAPLGSGLSIMRTLPVAGVHKITCTATDSTMKTGSDSITLTVQSPVAQINHPGSNETRSATLDIPFVGVGRDLEDGALTGNSLVWTTVVNGNNGGTIGTGASFNAKLAAGTNVVTLTATDSNGNKGTASITLTITP